MFVAVRVRVRVRVTVLERCGAVALWFGAMLACRSFGKEHVHAHAHDYEHVQGHEDGSPAMGREHRFDG